MNIFNHLTNAISKGFNLDDTPSAGLAASPLPVTQTEPDTQLPKLQNQGKAPKLSTQSKPLGTGQESVAPQSHTSKPSAPGAALPEGTKAVRLLWCDSAGVRRCRVIPTKHWQSACQKGIGITKACMATTAYADAPVLGSGLSAIGEVRLVPDASTLVPLVHAPGHFMVLGNFFNCQLLAASSNELVPWSHCPRTMLRHAAELMEKECGLTMRVGFETEFTLLSRDPSKGPRGASEDEYHGTALQGSGWIPADGTVYAQSSAVDEHANVLDAMASALEAAGIDVQQYHAEAAPGQFEIATGHYPLMEAADKLLVIREVICGVARKHGMEVTLLPRPLPNMAGNGCHCHYSLYRNGKPVMQDPKAPVSADRKVLPQPSRELQAFTSGVLNMLDALLPFTAPSPYSYARFKSGTWAGAYRIWGWNNREAPIRLTASTWRPEDLAAMHVEYKAMDNTANPHIALAAIIVAGLMGTLGNAILPEPVMVPPGELDDAARKRLHADALPTSLTEALAVLEGREGILAGLSEVLGKDAVESFLAVRAAEAQAGVPAHRMLLRYS